MPQVVSDTELPSAVTLSGLQFNISGVVGPVLGGLLGFVGRSEFCIYYQCRLFPLGDSVHSAMETINGVAKVFVGKLLPIVRDGYPLRS